MKKVAKPILEKPEIYGSVDTWGYIINDDLDKISLFTE